MDQRVSTAATSGTTDPTEVFIARWKGVTAGELAAAPSFVIELCDLLGVSKPHATPAQRGAWDGHEQKVRERARVANTDAARPKPRVQAAARWPPN